MIGEAPISRLAILDQQGGGLLVLTLRAYFDESGHGDDPAISHVTMGGAITSLEAWARCESDWSGVLRDFGVRQFHMKDLAHFRGEFAGWAEPRRRSFLGKLMGLMERDVMVYVGAAVPMTSFRNLPTEEIEIARDPYWGGLIHCIKAVTIFADRFPPGQQVQIVFADHPEFARHALSVYQAVKQMMHNGARLGAATFASPANVPALQVADWVAYELRHYFSGAEAHGSEGYYYRQDHPQRWPLRQFFRKGFEFIGPVKRREEDASA